MNLLYLQDFFSMLIIEIRFFLLNWTNNVLRNGFVDMIFEQISTIIEMTHHTQHTCMKVVVVLIFFYGTFRFLL